VSCDLNGGGGGLLWDEPLIETGQVALTKSPGLDKLAAYYCPEALGETTCDLAVGSPPPETDLLFRFDLPLMVTNPNTFAIPAVELLTVIDLFPGEQAQHLAAICVAFCEDGDATCTGDPGAGACSSDEPEINSIEDFAQAAENYLSVYVESQLSGQVPPELKVRMLAANAESTLHMLFDIAPDPLLQALQKAFLDNIDNVLAGNYEVTIPYSIQGSLFFVIESVGKIGVNFGPIQGEWKF
jgi:hypothetical protein